MKESKPLNILYKKSINKIEAELLKIRKQFSSSPCQPDDIQILRWVLLACICIDINTPNDRRIVPDVTSFASEVESMLGDFVPQYVQGSKHAMDHVLAKSIFDYLDTIQKVPLHEQLLPYALEILEYSESEIKIANYDRRSGIITKTKKQQGVYYTPADVAKYMVSCCLAKLNRQNINLVTGHYIDYSCGSGIFLLQLLDCLIEKHLLNSQSDYISFVHHNLFGVDISISAVECCRYSIIRHFIRTFHNCDRVLELWNALKENVVVADATNIDSIYLRYPNFPQYFECIIGNPPYVGSSNLNGKAIQGNLFIPFVYNLMKNSAPISVSSLVIPLSFSYNNQPAFRQMRNDIQNYAAEWQVEHYDRSPDSLFGDDVKSRACIIFRSSGKSHAILSTKLFRWTSENRALLLNSEKMGTDISNFSIIEFLPKLNCKIEKNAFTTILQSKKALQDVLKSTSAFSENCIVLKSTAYNWVGAYDHVPPSFNSDGSPYFSKETKIFDAGSKQNKFFAVACLNSRLAFWLWTVVGDGFHLTNRLLSVFKIDGTENNQTRLSNLGETLSRKLVLYPITSYNGGKAVTSYNYNMILDIVDEIDLILVESLDIDTCFADYLKKWYSDIVRCGRTF